MKATSILRHLPLLYGCTLLLSGSALCRISIRRLALPFVEVSGSYWDETQGIAYNDSAAVVHAFFGVPIILIGLIILGEYVYAAFFRSEINESTKLSSDIITQKTE